MTGEHPFGHWRYLVLNGRIKKRVRESPRREEIFVRRALDRIGVRYKQAVAFRNPLFRGYKGEVDHATQWLDFCLYYNKKLLVLLFTLDGMSGIRPRSKQQLSAKKQFLSTRGTPFLVLPRTGNIMEYEVRIRSFLRKEAK